MLVTQDWLNLVERLGGAGWLEASVRKSKAFLRPREIKCAVDLLRIVLAYCLGTGGLRSTAAWATSVGLVDVSNPSLFYRLQQCGDWFSVLIDRALSGHVPKAASGRLIRIIDGTSVPKADRNARKKNG